MRLTYLSLIVLIGLFFGVDSWAQDTLPKNSRMDSLVGQYKEGVKARLKSYEEQFNNNDSLFTKYDDRKEEIKQKILERLKAQIHKTSLEGELQTYFKYGLLTDYIDSNSTDPLEVHGIRGTMSTNPFGIPFKLQFNYANYQNPVGVNNYFRISYDKEFLKRKLEIPDPSDLEIDMNKQIGINKEKMGDLKGSIGYSEVLQAALKEELTKKRKELTDSETSLANCDQSKTPEKCDSIRANVELRKQQIADIQQKLDTVLFYYEKAKGAYEEFEYANKVLEEQSGVLKNNKGEILQNRLADKVNEFMAGFTKFNIGLAYPNTSSLTSNAVPMKGFNFEWEKNKIHLEAAAGYLINNQVVTSDKIQNNLLNQLNPFNQFDFQQIRSNPFLGRIMGGYGNKNENHLYLGMNYLKPSSADKNQSFQSLNIELSGRYGLKKWPNIYTEVSVGKTSWRDSGELAVNYRLQNAWQSIFTKHTESVFGQIKTNFKIEKLKADGSATFRNIGTDTDTKVFGVLQPDNRRMELKLKKSIGKRNNLGINYRIDRNNLNNRADSTNYLSLYGLQYNGSLLKNFSQSLSYTFVNNQSVQKLDKSQRSISENYMLNMTLNYVWQHKKTKFLITTGYNDVQVYLHTNKTAYQNMNVQFSTYLSRNKNLISLAWFKEQNEPTNPQEAMIITEEFTFKLKRIETLLGLKFSQSTVFGKDLGAKVEIKWKIIKSFDFYLLAEKLVFGNFYAAYNPELFHKFPYTIQSRITYNFKR